MNNIYYAVEIMVDGFGHDTLVDRIFLDKIKAQKYADKVEGVVIKGQFGNTLKQIYG